MEKLITKLEPLAEQHGAILTKKSLHKLIISSDSFQKPFTDSLIYQLRRAGVLYRFTPSNVSGKVDMVIEDMPY